MPETERRDTGMDMQHKIRSLLQQAASTHSEHEAQEAILKAHALMAKYLSLIHI